ncbi:MAG: hypothetical protein R3Y54_05100 [Eubacteriales bacterium]
MERKNLSVEEIVQQYKGEVNRLVRYIPWLETKKQNHEQAYYTETDTEEKTLPVPVYDSTLLQLIKEIRNSKYLNKNYSYVYSKYRITSAKDEKKVIAQIGIEDIDHLYAILSRYVIKGMTKGIVWTEGVQEGIYLQVILKMKELIEFREGLLMS